MFNNLLNNKIAVVFGAGGHLGKQVVEAFTKEGATVYAADINEISLNDNTRTKVINALDEKEVANFMKDIIAEVGRIDIVTNLSASFPDEYGHGNRASEITLEQFVIPLRTTTGTQFVTAKAAYKHMSQQKSGVIIFITSTLSKVGSPYCTALTASHAATEGLLKALANEWGGDGVRVLGVRTEAMYESPVIQFTFDAMGKNVGMTKEEMKAFITEKTSLKKLTSAGEVAKVFCFAASDLASYMTGTVLNHSGGHVLE